MTNENQGSKMYLFGIVLVAVLGGLLFGYDTAVISGAEKGLQAFFMGAPDFVYTDFWHGITSSSAAFKPTHPILKHARCGYQ